MKFKVNSTVSKPCNESEKFKIKIEIKTLKLEMS